HNPVYENAQARERTQILMDMANKNGAMLVGTGDMSEIALGWSTYNGDHMSMYNVNCGVPKTLARYMVAWIAMKQQGDIRNILLDVVNTPISPELVPADKNGNIKQKTEDLVGPYELHDFFLYNFMRHGFSPSKIQFLATEAFGEKYGKGTIKHWLTIFFRRFFSMQFKRSCSPDGPAVGSIGLSPRGGWIMPSDVAAGIWIKECENLQD
ncbi:MAG: NAD(+) synthase, partial [Bacteroidales bacterium]